MASPSPASGPMAQSSAIRRLDTKPPAVSWTRVSMGRGSPSAARDFSSAGTRGGARTGETESEQDKRRAGADPGVSPVKAVAGRDPHDAVPHAVRVGHADRTVARAARANLRA